MTTLLDQFDIIFNTPESVDKLKKLILDMAVKGKLVSQNQNDEPASALLERVKKEKEQLIKEKKIKKEKFLTEIKEEEKTYKLPIGWEWSKIGEIINPINGKSFKTSEWSQEGLPIIRIQNLNNIHSDFNYCNFEVDEKFHVDNGDLLIGWSGTPGTSFGAFIWQRGKAVLNQHIFKAQLFGNEIFVPFLRYVINSKLDEMISKAQGGVGLKHVTKGDFVNIIIAIPPLNEQKRIVEKIDQLMSFCQELKKRLDKKLSQENLLNISAFSSLAQSSTPKELQMNLRFVLDNLSSLCTDIKHVQQLRNVIMLLAVKGELVPQEENDEPASVLLEKVKEEKERLIKVKKAKKEELLSSITETEKPYGLKRGWEWARLGKIIHLISGQHLTPDQYNIESKGMPYLTGPSDFQNEKAYITKWTEVPKVIVEEDDILITVKGSGVGKSIILDVPNVSIGRQLMAIRPVLVDKHYIHLFIQLYKKEINNASIGIAIPGISRGDLLNLIIPVPPLNEQKRILQKVSQLMTLCTKLENQIKSTNEQREYLLEALLYQATQQQDTELVQS